MDFYLHPQGICESKNVGKGTRIYAFAHVSARLKFSNWYNDWGQAKVV